MPRSTRTAAAASTNRRSARPAARPSARPAARPSARPAARPSARPAARPSARLQAASRPVQAAARASASRKSRTSTSSVPTSGPSSALREKGLSTDILVSQTKGLEHKCYAATLASAINILMKKRHTSAEQIIRYCEPSNKGLSKALRKLSMMGSQTLTSGLHDAGTISQIQRAVGRGIAVMGIDKSRGGCPHAVVILKAEPTKLHVFDPWVRGEQVMYYTWPPTSTNVWNFPAGHPVPRAASLMGIYSVTCPPRDVLAAIKA